MTAPVQTAIAISTGSGTISLTFTNNITPGNSVVIATAGNAANISSASGSSDTYTVKSPDYTGICYVNKSVGGYKTVTVVMANAEDGQVAFGYELPGSIVYDTGGSVIDTSGGTTYDSGSVASSFASEFWVGVGGDTANGMRCSIDYLFERISDTTYVSTATKGLVARRVGRPIPLGV
jgi:hypothetical protein